MIVYAVMQEDRDGDRLSHILGDKDKATELAAWLAHQGYSAYYVTVWGTDDGRQMSRTPLARFDWFDTKYTPVRVTEVRDDGTRGEPFVDYFDPSYPVNLGMGSNTSNEASMKIVRQVVAGFKAGTVSDARYYDQKRKAEWEVLPARAAPTRPAWYTTEGYTDD